MSDQFGYVWLIPFFPIMGTLINLLVNRNRKLAGLIACLAVALSFLLAVRAFFQLTGLPPEMRSIEVVVYPWMTSGNLSVDIAFLIDPLSVVMMLVVTGVGLLIHIYSVGYMGEDPGYIRYFSYLNLFTFAMLLLVMANNFLLMFVGWEGVGLCSYLLIGFWYERLSAANAGIKAFVVNRVGDFAFILGMLLIFVHVGSLNYSEVFDNAANVFYPNVITAVTLLLFVGAMGKSAQIPLYVWLPDAMEGPTPVSALIHAATMVTAGVYMVARCHALYLLAPTSMTVVAVVGAATAIFAASIGLVQHDIKRVLAYSTVSQLGYMFLACGVGVFTAGVFHLVTHAFFKSLLFMGAGSVIHAMHHAVSHGKDPQDMRNMGGLRAHMPRTYTTMFVATLAIAGIFPFAGFFSKDAILWGAFVKNQSLWAIGAVTALMTAFYMFRLLFLTFHGRTRLDEHEAEHLHESPAVMTTPLVILAVLSLAGGFIGIPLVAGGDRLGAFLEPVFSGMGEETGHHSVGLELGTMLLSLALAAIGIGLAYRKYLVNGVVPGREEPGGFHRVLLHKYYVDEIYHAVFIRPFQVLSWVFWKIVDAGLIDGTLNVLASMVRGIGGLVRYLQTGVVQNYALVMIIGAIVILWYLVY